MRKLKLTPSKRAIQLRVAMRKSKPTKAGEALRRAAEACQFADGSCLYGELYRAVTNRRGVAPAWGRRAWRALELVGDAHGNSYDWWGRPNALLSIDMKHPQHERVLAGLLAAVLVDTGVVK